MASLIDSPADWRGPDLAKRTDWIHHLTTDEIAEIEAGHREPVVRVGNLEAARDFTDVRDVVRAYWLALQLGQPGQAYNVGSGKSYRVRELLDILLELSPAAVGVEIDPDRLRPSDVPVSVCNPQRLWAATNWQPEIELRRSLEDLLNSWRRQIARNENPEALVDADTGD